MFTPVNILVISSPVNCLNGSNETVPVAYKGFPEGNTAEEKVLLLWGVGIALFIFALVIYFTTASLLPKKKGALLIQSSKTPAIEFPVEKQDDLPTIVSYLTTQIKTQQAKKKQKHTTVKEIKFRPGTEDADYQVKLKKLVQFLENGDKTKVTLRFRGREMAHQDLGAKLLKRIEGDLEEYGKVEQFPKMEGRQMVMVIAPHKV